MLFCRNPTKNWLPHLAFDEFHNTFPSTIWYKYSASYARIIPLLAQNFRIAGLLYVSCYKPRYYYIIQWQRGTKMIDRFSHKEKHVLKVLLIEVHVFGPI